MSILNSLNIILESKLVRYFLFLTLLFFVFASSAQFGVMAFMTLAVVDAIYVPSIMLHIRKNGRFYLVFDALHKLMTMVALSFILVKFYGQITSDIVVSTAFISAFLYIVNYNFDINDTFFSNITIFGKKDHTKEGYSNQAIDLIKQIEKDEADEANKGVIEKGSEMLSKYAFNAHFQFGTLRAIVLGDKEYIDVTESISLEWGMKEVAEKMTILEIAKNNFYRILADIIVVATGVWMIFC